MQALKKTELKAKSTTEDPELAARFNRVLGETVEALEEEKIPYAFIGGVASGGLGRPRSTHDIDVFVKPEDAEITLRALKKRGFSVDRIDPSWLYKGFKEGILVDVIFKSKGEIYLDSEMYQRSTTAEFHGRRLKLVAPEDLTIIKAAAHSELTPGHWHDALALLTHANIDWDYLVRRSRRAPRRLLSLLLYAQSADIFVPKQAIDQLYEVVFGDAPLARSRAMPQASPRQEPKPLPKPPLSFAVETLREAFAQDSRLNELDIQIVQSGSKLLLRGEVLSDERKSMIEKIAREKVPHCDLESQIRVLNVSEPSAEEEIK